MASSDNKKVQEARAGARRLIEQGPKVLLGLFAMSGVAYLAGSVYTRSYFSEFGASWILEEVPAAVYFSQSSIPLLLILFVGYLATTNLVLIGNQSNLAAGPRFKVSTAAVTHGPWVLMGLLAIISLSSSLEYVTAAIALSVISILFILFLSASALEILVVRFTTIDRGVDLSMVYVSVAMIAVALYLVPAQLGVNRARVDKQDTSSLPRVYVRDDVTEYKLLFAVDERWYVFPTRYAGSHPPVKAIAAGQVTFVPDESRPE